MSLLPDGCFISPEDYLKREAVAEEKNEYIDGIVYAMSGGSFRHNLIVANLLGELRAGLRGSDCRAYASDLKITTPNRKRYFYPDASVICGNPVAVDNRTDIATNPTVLFEVLSTSTSAYDRGTKFLAYQSIPSLQDYILISQDEHRLECYHRQATGWLYRRVEDSKLFVESIEVELKFEEVYLGV